MFSKSKIVYGQDLKVKFVFFVADKKNENQMKI